MELKWQWSGGRGDQRVHVLSFAQCSLFLTFSPVADEPASMNLVRVAIV